MTDRLRVRFAPSPTGQLHVGNVRTALFNWLLARGRGGAFILRIEDTDSERSTREAEASAMRDLRWLGLDWDEGPDVGGPFAPYRQSDRFKRYAAAARTLLEGGRAYWCFCTPEELEANRQGALAAGQPPKYSGRCRGIDRDTAAGRVNGGERAAIRFVVPPVGDVTFHDLVRGDVTVHTDVIGDPVIVRSDGRPVYSFAAVVDDAHMEITDVIRGEDHISNTPRQVLMYAALGLTPPRFAHVSMVHGPDHTKLSKRHGVTSAAEFRERGYLPEALTNYLALLGWSPGGDQELMPLSEMAARFDLAGLSHSAAVFDPVKLAWMNRHYLKDGDPARVARLARVYFARAGYVQGETDAACAYIESLLPLAVGSVDRLEEIPMRVSFVFDWSPERAAALVSGETDGWRAIAGLADALDGTPLLDKEAFRRAATAARERSGLKARALFHPIRVALTAADAGPELDLAVPAIDRGAALGPGAGVRPILSVAQRVSRLLAMQATPRS